MAKKFAGYICDYDKCRKFFTHPPIFLQGKKRGLHFCSFECQKEYLKNKGK